jgi:hypothetical protein
VLKETARLVEMVGVADIVLLAAAVVVPKEVWDAVLELLEEPV